jgi:hypothetical protein
LYSIERREEERRAHPLSFVPLPYGGARGGPIRINPAHKSTLPAIFTTGIKRFIYDSRLQQHARDVLGVQQ